MIVSPHSVSSSLCRSPSSRPAPPLPSPRIRPPPKAPLPQISPPSPSPPPGPLLLQRTAFPPVHIAASNDHPFQLFSLVFLQTGVLRQWDTSGAVKDLVTINGTNNRLDRVQLYDLSSGGALVAILHRNATGQTEIVLYDRAAGAIRWTQTIDFQTVTALELSPDNLWLAYAGSGTGQPGGVGVLPVEAPDRAVTLAECEASCKGIIWNLAGTRLIWSDDAGLWQADPALGSQTPEQLLEPPVQAVSSTGQTVTGTYTIGSFSPSGRYLLLAKGPFPETIPSVFDTQSRTIGDIPGSFLYADPGSSVAWLFGDLLAIGRAGLAADDRPVIEIWQVAPGSEAFFIQSGETHIGNSPAQAPFLLTQLPDTGVRFGLLDFSNPGYSPGNGLYSFSPADNNILKLNDLPFLRAKQALWTPDGSGVLLLTASKIYYIPANGLIYEMNAFLGAGACCFTWIP